MTLKLEICDKLPTKYHITTTHHGQLDALHLSEH